MNRTNYLIFFKINVIITITCAFIGIYRVMRNTINHQTMRLVAGAKSGDRAALEQLYQIYSDRVLRIVRIRMGNELRSKMQSMDLVQDALFSAFSSIESFTYKNEGDFLRWISSITENKIRDNVDKLHATKRDIRKEVPLSNRNPLVDSFVATHEPIDNTTPSIIVSRHEELDKLEKAMQNLKPEYRNVLLLIKIEGLSYKEAAEKLNKSPDAVRMLLSRALAALTAIFEENNGTAS